MSWGDRCHFVVVQGANRSVELHGRDVIREVQIFAFFRNSIERRPTLKMYRPIQSATNTNPKQQGRKMTAISNATGPNNIEYSVMPNQAQISAEFGGDTAAELAAMLFMCARERSNGASERRDMMEEHIQAYEARQVDNLHDAADARFSAALVSGYTQIVSGALGVAGASSGSESQAALCKALGQAYTGAGEMAGGAFKRVADNLTADATAEANKAQAGIRSLKEVEEDSSDAQDMKQRTLDFLDSLRESRAEADKALVSIRA